MCYLNSSRDHTTLDWSAQIQCSGRNDHNLIWLSKPWNSKINTLWDTSLDFIAIIDSPSFNQCMLNSLLKLYYFLA